MQILAVAKEEVAKKLDWLSLSSSNGNSQPKAVKIPVSVGNSVNGEGCESVLVFLCRSGEEHYKVINRLRGEGSKKGWLYFIEHR